MWFILKFLRAKKEEKEKQLVVFSTMKLMASQANGRHLCCQWQSSSKLGKMPLLTNQKGCCHIAIPSLRGLQICNHCTQGFFHLCLSDYSFPFSREIPRMFTDFSFIWAWTHHCFNASLTNTHLCNRWKSNKLQLQENDKDSSIIFHSHTSPTLNKSWLFEGIDKNQYFSPPLSLSRQNEEERT